MKCRRFRGLAALHAGGDLSPRRRRRLERHLASCRACSNLLLQLQETRAELRLLRESSLGDSAFLELEERIRGALEGKTTAQHEHRAFAVLKQARWQWRLAAAALVALAAMAALVVLRAGGPRQTGPTAPQEAEVTRDQDTPVAERQKPDRTEKRITTVAPHHVEPSRQRAVPRSSTKQTLSAASEARTREMAPQREAPEASSDLVIRIVTDNPDIVIYWLVGKDGG